MSPTIGPYSPVRWAGEWVVTAGQVGVAPDEQGAPRLVPGGFEAEARQAFANLRSVLVEESVTLHEVVKATVYLVDMGDFESLNTVWNEQFTPGDIRPARTTVAVAALPLGARIEVEAWAWKRNAQETGRTTPLYI
jgi:2-iminobutanoate/2-iminopropanoate deaminase